MTATSFSGLLIVTVIALGAPLAVATVPWLKVPSVILLIGFVALAVKFGLETVLGAFVAGAVLNIVNKDSISHPQFRMKLDAIGNGFLIPVFFVYSGLSFDLHSLVNDPVTLLRVPVLLAALLIARGVPAVIYVRSIGRRPSVVAGLIQTTSLPFIVTATTIGVAIGAVRPVTAAALVAAGLMSVVLFPPIALAVAAGAKSTSPTTRHPASHQNKEGDQWPRPSRTPRRPPRLAATFSA